MKEDQGVAASPPGHQPTASAADASSQSGVPNAASSADVAVELKARGHDFEYFHYTPGPKAGSVAEVADAVEAAWREVSDPVLGVACRLGGAAFDFRERAMQRIDIQTGSPVEETPRERYAREHAAEHAKLLAEAADLIRTLHAQGSVTAAADETADAGSVPKG